MDDRDDSGIEDAIAGCLLGGAVGDSIGLPYEGLSVKRCRRIAKLPLEHRFVLGRGMVSDDTDHSAFVAQAIIVSDGDANRFRKALAWRLRWWLLCLPAGIGLATLRSILRLWLGFRQSGVFSAGNGPSMRSAVIGAAFASDIEARKSRVEASTLLTHTDPKAIAGAMAVAEIAARLVSGEWRERPSLDKLVLVLKEVSPNSDWCASVDSLAALCAAAAPLDEVIKIFGTHHGISGYTLHSVPFAIWAWYRHFGNYRATIEAVVQAGGDVDTVAAIAGALAGAAVGSRGIPEKWIDRLVDWPHGPAYLRRLAAGLNGRTVRVRTGMSPWLFPRGVLFTALVLMHGFRRLLPPY